MRKMRTERCRQTPSRRALVGVDDSAVFERGQIRGIEGVKACPLPDTNASSCWGMPYNSVTFHANLHFG